MSVNNNGLHFISLCLFSIVVVTAFQPRYQLFTEFANNANDANANCTNCKANMSTLGKFLANPDIIHATVESFHRDLCPYEVAAAYLEDCKNNVTKLWPSMAKGLFSSSKAQGDVCQGLKKCNAPTGGARRLRPLLKETNQKDDPICDACTSFVTATATWMKSNDSIALSKGFWNGTDFCGAAKPLIPVGDCRGFIDWFTEPAITTLSEVMLLSTKAVCQVGFHLCH